MTPGGSRAMTATGFRGIFPSLTLANEVKGARDGRDSGTFMEVRVAPRARLLAHQDVWMDVVLPLALGMSLHDYYQLVDRGDTSSHESHARLRLGGRHARRGRAVRARADSATCNVLPSLEVTASRRPPRTRAAWTPWSSSRRSTACLRF